jgi:hypothetical protein
MTNDLKQALMTPHSVFPNQPSSSHYPTTISQSQQAQQPVTATPIVANNVYNNRTEPNTAVNNLEEAIVKVMNIIIVNILTY